MRRAGKWATTSLALMRKGKLTATGLITPVIPLKDGPDIFHLIQNEPDKVLKFAVQF